MTIDKLDSRQGHKSITVTFNYDEIRDIANGLYYLTSDSSSIDKNRYKAISADCSFLFNMIKHGNIQPETIDKKLAVRELSK